MNITDMVKKANENVTPWPALYDNGAKTEECGYVTDIENVENIVFRENVNTPYIEASADKFLLSIKENEEEIKILSKQNPNMHYNQILSYCKWINNVDIIQLEL